jgi:hypothetical protein
LLLFSSTQFVRPYDIDAIIGSAFYCEPSVLAANRHGSALAP